jgi:hypothetical protein
MPFTEGFLMCTGTCKVLKGTLARDYIARFHIFWHHSIKEKTEGKNFKKKF